MAFPKEERDDPAPSDLMDTTQGPPHPAVSNPGGRHPGLKAVSLKPRRDVAKCDGHDCPRRNQCARFLAPILTEQNLVIVEDPANCDLFTTTENKP